MPQQGHAISSESSVALEDDLVESLRRYAGHEGPPTTAPAPVSASAIRAWCVALGDSNPIYLDEDVAKQAGHGGIVAPPAMLQAWTMPEFGSYLAPGDPTAERYAMLDKAGFSSVVATNSEQECLAPVRIGDRISSVKVLESVSGRKETALGPGYFLTTTRTYTNSEDVIVGKQTYRVLKYRANNDTTVFQPPSAASALRPRPVIIHDTAEYWQACRQRRLMIQRCSACGSLQHPPNVACLTCGSLESELAESSGTGEVFTYTVVHAPVVDPFVAPYAVVVVQLDDGVRIVSELVEVPPTKVEIGMRVELVWRECDPELTLPVFRPVETDDVSRTSSSPAAANIREGDALPPLQIPITRSLIIATAIASGDYYPVHHDPEFARRCGLPDIITNVLSTNGLVARYVTDWAGTGAVLRSVAIRLGMPNYPGDMLVFSGNVTARAEHRGCCLVELAVQGRNDRGDHVTATVEVEFPLEGSA